MPSESNICEVTFIVAILDPLTLELEVMQQDVRIQKLEAVQERLVKEIELLKAQQSRSLPQVETQLDQPIPPLSPLTPSPVELPVTSPEPAVEQSVLEPATPTPTATASAIIIDKSKLRPAEEVLAKYNKLCKVSQAGVLSCKLAREAFFGEDVLRQCTPLGKRDLPPLPIEELAALKETLVEVFPLYHKNRVEFEEIWSDCITALQQLCKRLRLNH